MSKIYPIIVKRIIHSGGVPTFTINETEQRADKFVLNPLKLTDREARADTLLKLNPLTLTDGLARVDAYRLPTISIKPAETIARADKFSGVANIISTRMVPTDSNFGGDGWVDSLLANNGVNHGNESPLPIDGALLSATQNDAFMEFDLTRFGSLTAPSGGIMTLSIHAVQALAVAQTFTAVFSKFASRPFLESTLNFTNKPADGTNTVTKSVSVLVGTVPTNYDMILSQSEYSAFMGNFMMVRFSSTAVLATPINISSREDTTTANKPQLVFNFERA